VKSLPLLAAALLLTAPAAAQPAPPLSPDFAETLRWFPADVDAFLVSRDFKLPDDGTVNPIEQLAKGGLPAIFRAQHIGPVGDPDEPPTYQSVNEVRRALAGRQVEFALLGAREVFPASAFGSCGYAGCHVVRFTEPLGPAADQLAADLRKDAVEILRAGGREIAAFKWAFPKEPYLKTRSWEGLFIVLPLAGDREIFIATQRRLLDEALARRAAPATQRAALPPEISAWKFVDTTASTWAVLAAPATNKTAPAASRDVISFEYHTGDDARFVFRAPSESIPDDPKSVDLYAHPTPPSPLAL
jgi:hypothetical protein